MAYFQLELDTTGPEISINVPSYVLSSADLDIVIQANEPLESSFQEFYLIDSLGQRHDFILTYFDTYYKGKVSLSGISLGVAKLYARVQDTVLNFSPLVSKGINITKGARVSIAPSIKTRAISTKVKTRAISTKVKTRPIRAVIK
jgi:hypothetical protein